MLTFDAVALAVVSLGFALLWLIILSDSNAVFTLFRTAFLKVVQSDNHEGCQTMLAILPVLYLLKWAMG